MKADEINLPDGSNETARYLVWDCETTGIDVFNDRIAQLVISTADSEGNLLETWEWVIDPGVDMPEEASNVHGLSTEFLTEHGRDPRTALGEAHEVFTAHTDLIWVAFNMNFDLTILDNEFARYLENPGFGDGVARYVRLFDPLLVDRWMDKYRKGKRKLGFLALVYGIPFNDEEAHDAAYDVKIAAFVAARVAEKFGIPSVAAQASAYRSWAEGLELFLRRTNPDATVDRDWPLKRNNA